MAASTVSFMRISRATPISSNSHRDRTGHAGSNLLFSPPSSFARQLQRFSGRRRRPSNSARLSVSARGVFGGFATAQQQVATPVSLRRLQQLAEEPVRLGWPWFDPAQYQLDEELGHGSFGTVFSAIDQDSGSRVAVKKIPKVRRNQQPKRTAAKLRREADLLQRLQGLNDRVVGFTGKCEDEFHAYIITEVLSGGTLEEYVEAAGGRLDEATCKWIISDVLRFLESCHASGIVYADSKPANFMIDDSDGRRRVKAIDIGCSQSLSFEGERLEVRSGTPLYFAPEVFKRSYGTEADLWSVGVMIYLFITGRNPWFSSLKGVVPADVEKKVLGEDVQYLPEEWADTSEELQDLVRRLLTKNPAQRITAAQALSHPWFAPSQPEAYASNVVPVPVGALSLKALPCEAKSQKA